MEGGRVWSESLQEQRARALAERHGAMKPRAMDAKARGARWAPDCKGTRGRQTVENAASKWGQLTR
eukprot:3134653-Alexandrium_andersonii.AAC.1